MLITLRNDKLCGWLVNASHNRKKTPWSKNLPPRLRIASITIGLLSSSKIFTTKDTIVYVGKKMIVSLDGKKRRQIRMILIDGQLGFLEGYDVKNFIPVQKNNINLTPED